MEDLDFMETDVDSEPIAEASIVGTSLDSIIGTWSKQEAAEFLEAVEVFEEIDASFWRQGNG
jgi:hypothetical protein